MNASAILFRDDKEYPQAPFLETGYPAQVRVYMPSSLLTRLIRGVLLWSEGLLTCFRRGRRAGGTTDEEKHGPSDVIYPLW